MVKIEDFYIEFDQKWAVYSPGDTVTGKVVFKINEKYACDSIVAQLYGSARIWWVERQLSPPNGMRSVPYTQERIYVDSKEKIWEFQPGTQDNAGNKIERQTGDMNPFDGAGQSSEQAVDRLLRDASNLRLRDLCNDDKRAVLPAGIHTFPFSFPLPVTQLPTSFDATGSGGCIRYFVKVSIKEGEKCKVSKKGYITVISPCDLNLDPLASRAVVKHGHRICKGSGLICMNISGGSIGLTLTLQKSGYVPGEPINVSAEIDNRSGRSVCGMKARLVQTTTCYSIKPEPKTKESVTCVSMVANNTKIRKGEMYLWDGLSFLVPAVNPSFIIDGLLEVEYKIVVEALVGKEGPNLVIDAPMLVGTVPLTSHVPAPAHGPTNLYYGEPPPSYEASVLGRSETQGNLIEEYLPRYAVYSNMHTPLIE